MKTCIALKRNVFRENLSNKILLKIHIYSFTLSVINYTTNIDLIDKF